MEKYSAYFGSNHFQETGLEDFIKFFDNIENAKNAIAKEKAEAMKIRNYTDEKELTEYYNWYIWNLESGKVEWKKKQD